MIAGKVRPATVHRTGVFNSIAPSGRSPAARSTAEVGCPCALSLVGVTGELPLLLRRAAPSHRHVRVDRRVLVEEEHLGFPHLRPPGLRPRAARRSRGHLRPGRTRHGHRSRSVRGPLRRSVARSERHAGGDSLARSERRPGAPGARARDAGPISNSGRRLGGGAQRARSAAELRRTCRPHRAGAAGRPVRPGRDRSQRLRLLRPGALRVPEGQRGSEARWWQLRPRHAPLGAARGLTGRRNPHVGDIVIYGNGSHAAIYIGRGRVYQRPQPATGHQGHASSRT